MQLLANFVCTFSILGFLLLHLELMPINYILMRLLHDIFKVCTLFHNILFYYFFREVADMSFMLVAELTFCWARR